MEEIEFNVTTPDAAYEFAKKFTGFTGHELINAYIIESDSDFDEFWERYHEGFEQLGINEISLNEISLVAYHVVGSIDECAEIINEGILNLQTVLSQDTSISRLLKNYGIIFDIHNRIMICDGKEYNIDHYAYEDIFNDDCLEGKLKKIGNSPTGWPLHGMEHVLSAYDDITHGVGLAIITHRWMTHVLSEKELIVL